MHTVSRGVDAVKAAARQRVHPGDVVAVVRKFFAGCEARGLADDAIPLNHQLAPIGMLHHPFSSQQGHGMLGLIADRDEVDERMRFVRRQAGAAVMMTKTVQMGREAFDFA